MPGIILAIDSNYEQLTEAASAYREQHVYPYFVSNNYQVNLVQGPDAQRSSVAPAASDPGVVLITGVGHGTYSSFTGYYNYDVFSVGNYAVEEVQGKIAHLLSCSAAKILGADLVANGCRAFFGYDEAFSFDPDSADMFFECDAEIDRALAEGLNAATATARAKTHFDQTISKLLATGDEKSVRSAAVLGFNRDHLRSPVDGPRWGDQGAKLP